MVANLRFPCGQLLQGNLQVFIEREGISSG